MDRAFDPLHDIIGPNGLTEEQARRSRERMQEQIGHMMGALQRTQMVLGRNVLIPLAPLEALRDALNALYSNGPVIDSITEWGRDWTHNPDPTFKQLLDGVRTALDVALGSQRITHGRHCKCTPCAREDWTNPELGPCGMHGPACPRVYAPMEDPR